MDEDVRKAAIDAVIQKRDALLAERKQLMTVLDDLAHRLRRNEVALFDCRSAGRLFGASVLLPEEIGREFYFRRENIPRAPSPPAFPPVPPAPSYVPIAKPTGVAVPATSKAEVAEAHSERPVREYVLTYLKRTPAGAKAAEIRAWVEGRLGRELHPKTVGMTLYRLSEKGLARRSGTTWFFASPEAENPGVGAPGSDNSAKREGDQDA